MFQVDTKIKPLISDIKKTNIDYYLATSSFERLTVRHKFDSLWGNVYNEAEQNRAVFWIGEDNKRYDSGEAFILLLDRGFRANRNTFDLLVYVIFTGYIDWIENSIELEDIFSDLELLDFPTEWLKAMKAKFKAKCGEIKMREDKKLKIEADTNKDTIDLMAIFETKKVEWLDKISMARTEETISDLKNFATKINNTDLIEEIVNQSQRWYRLQRKIRDNVLDLDKEQIECNKINKALLEIINSLKDRIEK